MSTPSQERFSLSALLSQALVAFTIEFDNEFEHQTPHCTTQFGGPPGIKRIDAPWLVSMVMWVWILRFVPPAGIAVAELQRLARTSTKQIEGWLTRLSHWWGYVRIEGKGSSGRLPPSAIVRPTAGGSKAIAVWRDLASLIEDRWIKRFGLATIKDLCASLGAVAAQLDPVLPSHLPILGYGLGCRLPEAEQADTDAPEAWESALPALLSKVLLAWAIEFEQASKLALAIYANVVRLADSNGAPLRDLPRVSGVSDEAIATATKFLVSRGLATIETRTIQSQAETEAKSKAKRVKVFALTAEGEIAKQACATLQSSIEDRWSSEYRTQALRSALERVAGKGSNVPSPLLKGLQPYCDNWRASVPAPAMLPHFPMVLHRGGFPDGS
jgi:hypothetical protein